MRRGEREKEEQMYATVVQRRNEAVAEGRHSEAKRRNQRKLKREDLDEKRTLLQINRTSPKNDRF